MADEILSWTDLKAWAKGRGLREARNGRLYTECPADGHVRKDDRGNDLSLWEDKDGNGMVRCWGASECHYETIWDAIYAEREETGNYAADVEADDAPKITFSRTAPDAESWDALADGVTVGTITWNDDRTKPLCTCDEYYTTQSCPHAVEFRRQVDAARAEKPTQQPLERPAAPEPSNAPTPATNGAVRLSERENKEEETAMTTALATTDAELPATTHTWNKRQVAAIRKLCMPSDATEQDLVAFLSVCKQIGLNPFTRQAYAMSVSGRTTIMVGIDGLRALALRTGEYEGREGPFWCGDDGEWVDVWLKAEAPTATKVTVYRRGHKPYTAIARTEAFRQKSPTWNAMPEHMGAVRAESIALRAAFADALSGLYAPEEIAE